MLKQVLLVSIVISLMLAGSAQATLLYEESFDYATGRVDAQAGWSANVGDGSRHVVTSTGLTYTGLLTSGNRLVGSGTASNSHTVYSVTDGAGINEVFSGTGTYYITALMSNTDAQMYIHSSFGGANDTYIRLLKSSQTIRIRLVVNGSGQNDENNNDRHMIGSIPGGDPVLVAIKIVNDGGTGNDSLTMVCNPDLSQTAATIFSTTPRSQWNVDLTNDSASDGSVELMSYLGTNNNFDELRFASTWPEAAPPGPLTPPQVLTAVPASESTLDFGSLLPSAPDPTLASAVTLSNTGENGSTINVFDTVFGGADPGLFAISLGDVPTTLFAGADASEAYDLSFLNPAIPGLYSASLTFNTSMGSVLYTLNAEVVPEPATLGLVLMGAVGMLGSRRFGRTHRKRVVRR